MTDNFDQAMYDEAIQRMESALSQVSEFHMSFDTVWLEFMTNHGKEYAQFANEAWKDHSARFQKLLDDDTKEFTPSDSFLTWFHHKHTVGSFQELFVDRFYTEYANSFSNWLPEGSLVDYADLSINSCLNKRIPLKRSLLIAFNDLLKSKISKVKEVYESISATETNKDFHYGCRDYFQAWLSCKEKDKPMQFPYEDESSDE